MPDGNVSKTVGIQINRKKIDDLPKPAVMWYFVNEVFQEMYDTAVKNGFGGTFNTILDKYPIAQHFLEEALESAAKKAKQWVVKK